MDQHLDWGNDDVDKLVAGINEHTTLMANKVETDKQKAEEK